MSLEFNVLNPDLELIGIIDDYTEAIWTKRYWQCGDFEIYVSASEKNIELLQPDNYVTRDDDEAVMIIEKIEIEQSIEGGDHLIVSGRTLDSILDRRIVWNQTNLYGNIEDCIYTLIYNNCMVAGVRNMPRVKMRKTGLFNEKYEKQVTGDNILDVIISMCQEEKCGFKMYIDNGDFVFELYRGTDRSYNQTEKPFVVFSPEFDNLSNDKFTSDKAPYKNVALVAGEGEGVERVTESVNNNSFSGMERRELYVDARDISSNDETITAAEYASALKKRGTEKLSECGIIETVDGEVEASQNYIINIDYFLGDVVQVMNQYGIGAQSRILETIENVSVEGYKMIPTFSSWEI